ncbi:MAG: protein kinase [Deltaproteobacteria bacterium]|nr:protein kinase [Deltaproteobacteria bacterium]
MLSKRDLHLVRLACSRRFITAEQGEEVLALKRKLGAKLGIEEILRRQGYLDKTGLAELIEAADLVVGRRARPKGPVRPELRPTDPPEPLAEPKRPVPVAPSRRPGPAKPAAPSRRPAPPPRDVTRFEPNPFGAGPPVPEDEPPDDPGDRTIIAMSPGPQALAEAQAQARQAPKRPVVSGGDDDADRTALDMSINDVRAAVEAYKQKRALEEPPLPGPAKPARPGLPAPSRNRDVEVTGAPSPIGVPGGERTVFDFRPDFSPKVQTVPAPPVRPSSFTEDPEAVEGEDDQPRTIMGMSPFETLERPTDPFGVLPDSSLVAIAETPSQSMPGESLATLMMQQAEAVEEAPLLDPGALVPVDDLLADEEAAEALLGNFGRYTLERVIARGQRSVVYLGTETESGTAVAIKILAGPSEEAAKLLSAHSEALVRAATLESPNLVRVRDAGRSDGRYFVALEYMDGWTLGDKLEADELLSLHDALSILKDVAQGLADAAQVGLLHGHLEADAIFLAEGRAVLGGIGLGPMSSPEDPEGEGRDLLALGAVFERLVTGQPAGSGAPIDPKLPVVAQAALQRLQALEPGYDAQALVADLAQALAEVAPGPAPHKDRAPLELGPLAAKAILGAVGVIAASILGPLLVQVTGLADWSSASAILRAAWVGALFLVATTVLFSVLSLIRRGELPLPMSSAWLVRLQESAGTLGAAVLVTGFSLAPPALLNLSVSALSVIVLGSGIFGWFLRRGVAAARSDRGIGRVLAVLGDPVLGRWREIHVPLTTTLACLACVRFALLAYFSAS